MSGDRQKGFQSSASSEWGATILWFCILLLTACVVASAAPASHTGTYTDGNLSLTITRIGDNISGTVTLGGKTFPLKAAATGMTFKGSFTANGKAFPFIAGIPSPGQMNFKTGDTLYHLTLQKAGADNPLNQPETATPAAAATPNPLADGNTPAAGTDNALASATNPPSQTSPFNTGGTGAASPVAVATARPLLRVQQGKAFRWSLPDGWTSNETAEGVDINSPDNRAGAHGAVLANMPGQSSPRGFIEGFYPRCGAQNLKVLAVQDLPDINYNGLPMKVTQMELTYDIQGAPYHGIATCAVANGFNVYTVYMQAIGAVPDDWEKLKTWLPAVGDSITITNPQSLSLQGKIALPNNRPLDDSSLADAWRTSPASSTAVGGKWEQTKLGYQLMRDPSTGQMYDMPFEAYNASRGGYVNPARPTELLQKANATE